MHSTKKIFASVAWVALASLGGPAVTPVSAQLANASASTLGKANNATASARGLEAMSVNPAGLGMPGSGFTLSFLPLQLRPGLDPINFEDMKGVEGQLISDALKEEWLARIDSAGGQSGSVGVDATWLALAMGPIGLQVSTLTNADLSLSPGMMEGFLYGNAGRTGNPSDLAFTGSTADVFMVSTVGFSFAIPMSNPGGNMALGATLKYSIGHFVGVGQDEGGSFAANPVSVTMDFPVLHTDDLRLESNEYDNGRGVGLDVGFQMQNGGFSFGAAVLNAFNTFAWDSTALVFRPGTASLTIDNLESDFDAMAYDGAPDSLKTRVRDMTFNPTVSVGMAYDLASAFTVSADVRKRLGEGGMAVTPDFHAGVGAEFRGLKIIHLRGGAAVITDGTLLSGGASLVLGPLSFSAAGALRSGEVGEAVLGQFTLSFGGR